MVEIIKKIIGQEAKKRGFAYSCTGKMPMTTPLAIYTRTDDNLTQMIYFCQANYNPNLVIAKYNDEQKEIVSETDEEFTAQIEDLLKYFLETGFQKYDDDLVDPFRVKIADQ